MVKRVEGLRKLTGRELYVDDLPVDDFLWGATVRSPAPRGRIRAVRFGDGVEWPELVVADVIAIDSASPTPLGRENLFGHLVYGASEAPVRHTVARGRVLMEDFRHTTLDPRELAAAARELAPALRSRFHSLEWGTTFLGCEAE